MALKIENKEKKGGKVENISHNKGKKDQKNRKKLKNKI